MTSGLLCFHCNQPNHLARDCLLRRKGRGDPYGGVDEVLEGAARVVIDVMELVTLRRRVRETRTGEAVCDSLQPPLSWKRRGFAGNEYIC